MKGIIVVNFKQNYWTKLEKMVKKLVSGTILTCFGPNLVPQSIFVGFISASCYALLQAIIDYSFKEN